MPFVVYLLGLTILALTTSEFMVAGMVPSLATALDVSIGKIGYLISLYALGMAIGGPLVTALLLALHMPNKKALLWLLVFYVAGGAVAALATSYGVMAAARVAMGMASSAMADGKLDMNDLLRVATQQGGGGLGGMLGGLFGGR